VPTVDGRPDWQDVIEFEESERARYLAEHPTLLLDFEAEHPRTDPARENKIRTGLGISPARYETLLNAAIDTEECRRHNPMLVNYLQLRRAVNRGKRSRRYEARDL
jgi:hypothetical protein